MSLLHIKWNQPNHLSALQTADKFFLKKKKWKWNFKLRHLDWWYFPSTIIFFLKVIKLSHESSHAFNTLAKIMNSEKISHHCWMCPLKVQRRKEVLSFDKRAGAPDNFFFLLYRAVALWQLCYWLIPSYNSLVDVVCNVRNSTLQPRCRVFPVTEILTVQRVGIGRDCSLHSETFDLWVVIVRLRG